MNFGLQAQELVIAKLAAKCDLKRDPEFDHRYKIDFVIDRFRSIAKLHHIGVQLTTNPIDNGKKARFVFERRKKELVDRSLYVDMHPDTNFDAYGIELLYVALVQFAFSEDHSARDLMGLSIGPGVTYRFYDIEKDVETARSQMDLFSKTTDEDSTADITAGEPHTDAPVPAPVIAQPQTTRYRGSMRKYIPDRGFGFIQSKLHNGNIGEWYFHISDCDSYLRDEIGRRLTTGDFKGIEVLFTDAGLIRKDTQSPAAINVSLHAATKHITA